MSHAAEPGGHDPSRQSYIEYYADLIAAYPEGEFLREDVNATLQEHIDSLRTNDVLERTGSETRETDTDNETSTYTLVTFTVADDARQLAESVIDARDSICPCGHSGVRNRGGHFECTAEVCDRQFSRDELEVSG